MKTDPPVIRYWLKSVGSENARQKSVPSPIKFKPSWDDQAPSIQQNHDLTQRHSL